MICCCAVDRKVVVEKVVVKHFWLTYVPVHKQFRLVLIVILPGYYLLFSLYTDCNSILYYMNFPWTVVILIHELQGGV